ncbi:hypothetical protein PHSC3_001637 [Chlamydiales bacterium STE3]|nr:hypothetical protein PHSC3_001637 [Chlamydiales bacterium STE3]
MVNKSKWHLVTLELNDGPTGEAISKIIFYLKNVIRPNFVILDYIDGGSKGNQIAYLKDRENQILKLEDFLKILNYIQIFDWGDFFLFEEIPARWEGEKDILYPPLVARTDTTVRAVDGTYAYVYTPHRGVVDIIKKNYEIESLTTDFLTNLPYPC